MSWIENGVQVSCPAPVLYFKRFKSVARSGQKNLAQGLPWEISTPISPEGPLVRASRLQASGRIACAFLALWSETPIFA
jgi:hypothetical protein